MTFIPILSEKDRKLLSSKKITENQLLSQLKSFRDGFPYLKVVAPATVERGIMLLNEEDIEQYIDAWKMAETKGLKVAKFVPASGAASRMFKDLFNFLNASYEIPTTQDEKQFFENLSLFAFYEKLNEICLKNDNLTIADLVAQGKYKKIIENLLLPNGLSYGNLPKGVLLFHKYGDGALRTPVEEHLQEGALYAKSNNSINLHFTVSEEHQDHFLQILTEKQHVFENLNNVKYNIQFSTQSPSTDTISVNADNTPFRVEGELNFRPGGHGALIQNLNQIYSDYIFIKNIDNIVPDSYKENEARYKMLLGGILYSFQKQTFSYLRLLDKGEYTHEKLIEMLYFLQEQLNVKNVNTKLLEDSELAVYIKGKLNRPIRVCGMVRNLGEPGGGPFLVEDALGIVSLQILESSQIDFSKSENKRIVESSTHFNPVDIVCGVTDFKGEKFDLLEFIDYQAGFISEKSLNGKKLKALELPGLWNGAMSDWNTIFVEVPVSTFNPVKTVNDLLRKAHI